MIAAKNCPDGIYGPMMILADVRVEGGVVTVIETHPSHDLALSVQPGGRFAVALKETGVPLPVQQRIRPLSKDVPG